MWEIKVVAEGRGFVSRRLVFFSSVAVIAIYGSVNRIGYLSSNSNFINRIILPSDFWVDDEKQMQEVLGVVSYKVEVFCPNCGLFIDVANDEPYLDMDEGNEIGLAVFGTTEETAKWEDLKLEYECYHCQQKFVLTKLEY